jgi:hypothetical protein
MITPIDPEVEAERLRHVRALIEELLREADVCGQVILAGRCGQFENFSDVRASWSCARLLDSGDGRTGIGVRSKLVDFGGDVARQKRELEWTLGMISGFAQIGAQVSISWLEAAGVLDAATNAEHTPLERKDPRDRKP